MADAELNLVIEAVDKASGTLKDINEQLGKTNDTVQKSSSVFGTMAKTAGGFLMSSVVSNAAGIMADQFGSMISGAMEAEEIQAQLGAVLASTGGKAGVTADQVNELASSLSTMTKFEDDSIVSAQNMLLTFTNIGSDVFPQATETMLNMSQAMGQDLQSSATQLGKALNDPVGSLGALTRVGVQFTDAQKEQIEAMAKSGDMMGAQKIILGELETQFGGAAEAAGGTYAGKMAILQNQLGNVKETIGGALLPVLTTLMEKLTPLIQQFAEWLPGALTSAGQAIERIQPILDTLGVVFGTVFGTIFDLIKLFTQVVTGDWAGAWQTMQDIVTRIWGAIEGVVKSGVNALIGMINNVINGINGIGINFGGGTGPFGFEIPAFSIGLPDIPTIPYLAAGGIVTRPTLAVVGERGPEAVVPLGRGGQGGNIVLELDGRVLARAIRPYTDGLVRLSV